VVDERKSVAAKEAVVGVIDDDVQLVKQGVVNDEDDDDDSYLDLR